MPQVEIQQQVFDEAAEAFRMVRKLYGHDPEPPAADLPQFLNQLVRLGLNHLIAYMLTEEETPAWARLLQDMAWEHPAAVFGRMVTDATANNRPEPRAVKAHLATVLLRGLPPASTPGGAAAG